MISPILFFRDKGGRMGHETYLDIY